MASCISAKMRDAPNKLLPVSAAVLPMIPRAAAAVTGVNSVSRTLRKTLCGKIANDSAPNVKHSVCCHEGGAENKYEISTYAVAAERAAMGRGAAANTAVMSAVNAIKAMGAAVPP